jgi:hypothetical protein
LRSAIFLQKLIELDNARGQAGDLAVRRLIGAARRGKEQCHHHGRHGADQRRRQPDHVLGIAAEMGVRQLVAQEKAAADADQDQPERRQGDDDGQLLPPVVDKAL